MILKSFLVEKNLSLIDKYSLNLFYGENIGLKDEIKLELKKRFSTYEKINFNQDEIIKNVRYLDEQINNTSLFSNKKLIFINEASDKIKNKIDDIIENLTQDTKIFLFAQNLEKKSTLRALFEKNKKTSIVPCYKDNHRTLSEYLKKKLNNFSGLNQEIMNHMIENSGFDRKILSHEIDKIRSLFTNNKIDPQKLMDLLNNNNNIDFDNLRDSCLEGDKAKLNKNLGNIMLQNEDMYFYLANLNLRIQKLLQIKRISKNERDIESIIDNLSPKIFWKDKPIIIKQMKKWNLEKLEKAKSYIIEAEIKMKTKLNNYNNIIVKNLLVRLYSLANSIS